MGSPTRRWTRTLATALPLAAYAVVAVACSSPSHPGLFQPPDDFDATSSETIDPQFDAPQDTAPLSCSAVEAGVLCACKEIGQRPTLIYVLLDRSGSMSEVPGATADTKWALVRRALLDAKTGALRKLGSKIRVGVAVFPGSNTDACATEVEAFPITRGSTSAYDKLDAQLVIIQPGGATPTAAALTSLKKSLTGVEGPLYVLLATDGGPNCNGSLGCLPSRCIPCIEHATIVDSSGNPTGAFCDATNNCCDPTTFGTGANASCLDTANTQAAVTALTSAGVKTFVLGVPGAGPYAADLNSLAVAGGTEHYYAASDPTQAALEAALDAITAKAVDSCVVTLESPPSDPGFTNVLVDGVTVPKDPVDGWSWGDANASIVLNGAACIAAKAAVSIQVAVGCKTVTQ
jgi:hypothetical protein